MIEQTERLEALLIDERAETKGIKLLLILALNSKEGKSISKIKRVASECGFPELEKSNVSQLLKSLPKKRAIKTNSGWKISQNGKKLLLEKFPELESKIPLQELNKTLRDEFKSIKSKKTKEFLEEAVACCECRPPLIRAGVILSWVGAISLLEESVLSSPQKLKAFNDQIKAHNQKSPNSKWKIIKTLKEFPYIQESDLLILFEKIGMIDKSTRKALEGCLDKRNACGHPSDLKVGISALNAHIETLIKNVYSQFSP